MNLKKIVITGGPATGKTTLINGLEALGYHCFKEVIREMTDQAKETGDLTSLDTNPINSVSDPLKFNQKLLKGRTEQFIKSQELKEQVVFFDRGIPDILAYMEYYGQNLKPEFIEAAILNSYDLVFILPLWKEIFTTDQERFESYDDALRIEEYLRKSYLNLGYQIIDVPCTSVEKRINFILQAFNC